MTTTASTTKIITTAATIPTIAPVDKPREMIKTLPLDQSALFSFVVTDAVIN